MPLDAKVKRFLGLLAASSRRAAADTLQSRRTALEELMRFAGEPPGVSAVEEGWLPGPAGPLRIRMYTPAGASGVLGALVYFHGGGLVAGSVATHDPIARALANAGRCRVVSVDYRLAPEHPFPAALDDALAATTHIAARAADFGVDGARLGVAGDSAGGTLAAAVCHCMALRGGWPPPLPGLPPLALQVLLCPILDHGAPTPSRREFAEGYLIERNELARELAEYLPRGVDPCDPRVSPLRSGAIEALPPAIIHTAEFDPLRDEGLAYFERLRRAGIAASYTCHPGMIHLFYGLGSVIPQAHSAFTGLGTQIRRALD